MKKKILSLIIIVCCFVMTGCARTLTYKTFKDKVKDKESFVLLVIQNGCSHCENFKPVFDKFANENNIDYFKLNLTNLSSNDGNDLNANYEISGTPTLMIFKDGVEQKAFTISGEVPVKTLKTVFKQAGYIK